MDDAFGRLMRSLDEQGLRESTLVFFTSDNGPAITVQHPHGSAGPLRDKKGSVYEGGIREPGMVRWPGRVKPGTVEYETFSLPLTNDWLPNPPAATHALKVTGKDEERLLLRIWIPNARPGDFMVVDDVQLWESADGTCSER